MSTDAATTESRVQLRWNPTLSRALNEIQRARLLQALATRLTGSGELVIACDTERSQHRNRDIARARLSELVRQGLVRQKQRHTTKVPRSAKRRRMDQKKQRSQTKRLRRRPDDD